MEFGFNSFKYRSAFYTGWAKINDANLVFDSFFYLFFVCFFSFFVQATSLHERNAFLVALQVLQHLFVVVLCNRADHIYFHAVSSFMVALCNRRPYIFSLFLFPRLISAVGDWMSAILPHMVWP